MPPLRPRRAHVRQVPDVQVRSRAPRRRRVQAVLSALLVAGAVRLEGEGLMTPDERARMRRWKQDRQRRGICLDCNDPARPGKTRCAKCAAKQVRTFSRYRERLQHEGICMGCKKWNDRQPLTECSTCAVRRKAGGQAKASLPVGTSRGDLTLLAHVAPSRFASKREARGLWRCACGKEKTIRISSVVSGATRSCGCAAQRAMRGLMIATRAEWDSKQKQRAFK